MALEVEAERERDPALAGGAGPMPGRPPRSRADAERARREQAGRARGLLEKPVADASVM